MKTLKAGDAVPNFTVNDQDGNSISLSDYKGKKLVVFFYPKASTPTCTVEACNLGENYSCLLYTSPSPRDKRQSRMPSSA